MTTQPYRTPYRTKSVVGEDYAAEKAQIESDMREAQSLPIDVYLRFLGNYGRILRIMADAYSSHEVAFGILQRHCDAVLDEIADEADSDEAA
ncbi:hypothetical protein [Streptomyces sp. AC558_RSS880]|uniref:hypothetical protein n=1 Tax=Streptomyces sp. AC558_RSS880 TaxID=2823687 RepID=UPI001C21A7FD|nr:hypothetical protein [Streptomyces sp. AC558_RSS880]